MPKRNIDASALNEECFDVVCAVTGQIAHDFNNLLTPMLAYPQLIREDLREGANGRSLLDVMEKTAHDMLHINQQLLELSTEVHVDGCHVHPGALIKEAIEKYQTDISRSGIVLGVKVAEDAHMFSGSQRALIQALHNLFSNALESFRGNGSLNITAENVRINIRTPAYGSVIEVGNYLKISVSDTGEGIADDIKGKIFLPFFSTRKGSKKRGSGLGLSIVYRVVKAHRGHIDFQSSAGAGTTFNLYFPAVTVPGTGAAALTGVATAEGAEINETPGILDSTRILIVDDEKTILRLFQMILSTSLPNSTIDMATNGSEAVKSFSQNRQAVVLMDLHMPVMDGHAAFIEIQKVCKLHNWNMPAVVFCTGFAPPDSLKSLLDGNSLHCLLSKPVGSDVLVEAVKSRLQ